jgi:copper chaperone CopZ
MIIIKKLIDMKTKSIVLTLIIMLATVGMQAQDDKKIKDNKVETVEIQTSAICGQCKERLEHDIAFEKGVKSVELNEETKVLTVTFKKGKNTKENLKKAITKIGYDADDMLADKKAHDALPKCCQKGNSPH